MEIEYDTKVVDRNGKVVGVVDYIMRNTWTGEISKFMVRQSTLGKEVFFSAEDVLQVKGGEVKLRVSLSELSKQEK